MDGSEHESSNFFWLHPSYKWDFCRVNPQIITGVNNPLTIRGMSHQVVTNLFGMVEIDG